MKSLLLIAMTLVSVTVFANEHKADHKADTKAAMEACKAHSKDKKAHAACMEEHAKAAATSAMEAAPAPKK